MNQRELVMTHMKMENAELRRQLQAMKTANNQADTFERFMLAALSGAASRPNTPPELVAEFAINTANALMNKIMAMVKEAPAEQASEASSDNRTEAAPTPLNINQDGASETKPQGKIEVVQ